MKTLDKIHFDNTYTRLPETFYRRVKPTVLPAPYLVGFNESVAELIGLDPQEAAKPEFTEYFSGNKLLPNSDPISAIYAGHQFGTFVPQLGDGRAILLGEAVNETGKRFDIQLKARDRHRFLEWATDARFCAQRFGNISARKRCMRSAFRRRARCASSAATRRFIGRKSRLQPF